MKVLSLIPQIMAVEPAVNWSNTKATTTLFIYPFEQNFEIRCLEAAEALEPNIILMFAFGEGPWCPDPDKIRLIKDKWPIIYMATDGACKGLWPALKRFKDSGCFTRIVNIDGSHDTPSGLIDLVTLSPLDRGRYNYRPFLRDRLYRLGFMGGQGPSGTPRRDICDDLEEQGQLIRGKRNEAWGSNKEYTSFMLQCKAVINFPQSGLGNLQVKARVLEAGLAGTLLLEHSPTITSQYFTPGEDYFEFKTAQDVLDLLETDLDIRQQMASRFREKVVPLTDPDLWLEKVMRIL